MSYAVSDIKNDLAGVFHGTTINKITNLAGLMTRAARQLLLDINPIETKRIAQLGKIFNSVYDYAIPTDLKGVDVIDIRPQAGRWPSNEYEQAFARWFDANKRNNWNNAFNIQNDTGVKTIRIEAPTLTSPVTITATGDTTGWTGDGAVVTTSSISLDSTNFVDGSGALKFNMSAGTGYIENTSLSAVDLSTNVGIASLFFWIYMPSVVTSVSLRWGSDLTTNYYDSGAITVQADGTAFKSGWNRLKVDWSTLTATGSPTATAYDSVRVTIVSTTALTGVEFCNLTSNIGTFMEMVYYSKYLFATSTGTWKETISDTDSGDLATTVNLDTESYNLYFNLLCYFICQQLQGADAQKDAQFFMNEYQRSLKKYVAKYKSETLLPSEPWYVLPSQRRGPITGPRWGI